MKIVKPFMILALCMGLLFSTTSCVVLVGKEHRKEYRKDNGKHRGWFKNSNNPHNPNSTHEKKHKDKKR